MQMVQLAVERLSPVGADVKSLRRETKRSYARTLDADAVKVEGAESPPKKHMSEKTKTTKDTAKSGASSGAATKKKVTRHPEVSELQGVVDGIQQQVDVASKGIEELKQLINSHLMARMTTTSSSSSSEWVEPSTTTTAGIIACVSPPASLMALDQDEDDHEFCEFPGYHHDALVYHGGEPMPFSC